MPSNDKPDFVNGPVQRALELVQMLQERIPGVTGVQQAPDPLTQTLHDQGILWKDLRDDDSRST